MRLRDKQTRVLETLPAPISKETAGFIKALPASTCSCMGDLLTDTQSFLEISESSEISLQGVSDAVNAVMGNTTLLDRIVVKGGQASTLKLRATARMFRAMLPVAPAVCTAIVSAAQTHAQQTIKQCIQHPWHTLQLNLNGLYRLKHLQTIHHPLNLNLDGL